MTTRDDLLNALARDRVPVVGIAGVDGLEAHTLSAVDGIGYSEAIEKLDAESDRVPIIAQLVVRSIRNGDGSLVFEPADAEVLPTLHGSRFWQLANAAMQANGTGRAEEETVKNSTTPEGDSGGT